MKTFDSGEPLSGWHFICPCGWSVHRRTGEVNGLEEMQWAGVATGMT